MAARETLTTVVAAAVLLGAGAIVAVSLRSGTDASAPPGPRAGAQTTAPLTFTRLSAPPISERLETADPMVQELIAEKIVLVEEYPDSADNWVTLGVAYHANDFLDVAIQCYETTIVMAPESPHARYWLATCLHRHGDAKRAMEVMRSVIALDNSYSPAHWHLGAWLLDAGDLAGAEAAYRRSINANAQDGAGWYGLADVYIRKDEPEKAVQIIHDRLLHGPYDPYARQLLARGLRAMGETERAGVEFARSAPGDAPWEDRWSGEITQYWTGRAAEVEWAKRLLGAGRTQDAVRRLQKVLRHHPEDINTLNNLAVTLGAEHRYNDALVHLRRARELAPNDTLTHLNLARIEYNRRIYGEPDAEDPLDLIERAIELDPTRQDLFEFLAFLYERNGLAEESLAALQEAARLSANPAGLLVRIADQQGKGGDLEDAVETLRRAVESDPSHIGAHGRLIILLAHMGQAQEAREMLERTTRLLDAAADPHFVEARQAVERAEQAASDAPGPSPDEAGPGGEEPSG